MLLFTIVTIAFVLICVSVIIVAAPKNSPIWNSIAMALAIVALILVVIAGFVGGGHHIVISSIPVVDPTAGSLRSNS